MDAVYVCLCVYVFMCLVDACTVWRRTEVRKVEVGDECINRQACRDTDDGMEIVEMALTRVAELADSRRLQTRRPGPC